jgi:hypothetical protein
VGVLRNFLQRHPSEVLIVILEDYVAPNASAIALAKAGLDPYLLTLKQGAPLPTLGSLVAGNRRLVVFAEEKGGSPAWYTPAFSFIQDTPLRAFTQGNSAVRATAGGRQPTAAHQSLDPTVPSQPDPQH